MKSRQYRGRPTLHARGHRGRSWPRQPGAGSLLFATRSLLLGLAIILVFLPTPAGAQESTEPEPTAVTITQEPGPCSNLGVFCERLLEWSGNEVFAETVAWIVGTPLKVAAICGLAMVANRLARRFIRSGIGGIINLDIPDRLVSDVTAERTHQRADAVGAMLRSTASTLIFGIAAIVILDTMGVSVIPVLASLGIAGIAIGFGAQKLIEDLISGVMIVVEDQLGVGDRVDVGHVEGVVERLTLRSTIILARNGVRWYVPNSEIRRVANESQHKGRASVQIPIAYDSDLRAARSTFHQAVVAMAEEDAWVDAGVEDIRDPFVAELGNDAVILEIRLFLEPTHRRSFERALKERLVSVAAAAHIEIPNPGVDVFIKETAS